MECKVKRLCDEAVLPKQQEEGAAGFDVHLIKLLYSLGDVDFYDTGLAIEPPPNTYFLLYPRSSLSKTDYWLANGVGVIDATYRGNLVVALRHKGTRTLLKLPGRYVQLIPQYHLAQDIKMVEAKELSETKRGEGKFGSTGVS